MRHSTLTLFLVLLCGFVQANPEPSKSNKKADDLFVWIVSEKLQLKPETETDFANTFKELSQKKQALTEQTDAKVAAIRQGKDPTQRKKQIEEYRTLVADLGHVQVQEIEKLSKILGDEKFSQYLGLKQELGKKIRDMISGRKSTTR